jgi:hypothetical protein
MLIFPVWLASIAINATTSHPPVLNSSHAKTTVAATGGFYPSQLNFSVPASAALDILGVDPSKASSFTSLHDLTAGLINSFDESGKLKNGFAFQFPVIRTGMFPVSNLFNSENERRLYFTNIALAAVKGEGDDPSARAAISVSIPFVDKTDWRYHKEARDELDAARQSIGETFKVREATSNLTVRTQVNQWHEFAAKALPKVSGELLDDVNEFLAAYEAHSEQILALPSGLVVGRHVAGVPEIPGIVTPGDPVYILKPTADTGVEMVVPIVTDATHPSKSLPVPRRITATTGGVASDIDEGQVTIMGTDPSGAQISEVLPKFTAGSAGTVTGDLLFKTVTSVTIPKQAGRRATTAIGFADDVAKPDWDALDTASRKMVGSKDKIEEAFATELYDAAVKKISDKYNAIYWNETKVDISAAYSLFSADANKDAIKGEGTHLAVSFATGLGGNGQITFVGRYASKSRSWDKDASVWQLSNTREFGIRYKGGSKDGGAFIEYLDSHADIVGGAHTSGRIFQVGYEHKLGENQWLQIAVGQGSGGFSKNVFGVKLSFNLSPDRQINEQGNVKRQS